MMVLLDGKMVDGFEVNSVEHKFIGTWRSPQPPYPTRGKSYDVYLCPCMAHLWTLNDVFQHWQLGHLDMPQYITIKKENIS